MIAEKFRIGYSAERRPPELSLESFLMNTVYQGLHVRIAMRKLLGIECPVAHIVLPTVVECHPLKSQPLRRWKGVIYLLRLHRSPISPGTPDGTESVIGSCRRLKSLLHHEAPVAGERPEVVSLVNRDEGAKGMKTSARFD